MEFGCALQQRSGVAFRPTLTALLDPHVGGDHFVKGQFAMRIFLAGFVALAFLVGCGDGDGDGGGTLPGGEGCLTTDGEGRPVQCSTLSGGSLHLLPGGAAAFCPEEKLDLERVRSCPDNERLVGSCERDMGFDIKNITYYYLAEGEIDEAAKAVYVGICEQLQGVWRD